MSDSPDSSYTTDSRPSIARRTVLSAMGTAGIGLAGIGAFSGSALAWEEFGVDFRGCSEVWLVVGGEDLNWKENYTERTKPLFVNVVVERDGEAECERVEFTEETATTIPGQYGDYPVVKFDGGDKILAVIKYNHNSYAICYVENPNQCAQTPNTPDWRDADCYEDLNELDSDRFNRPCADRDKLSFTDEDIPERPPEDGEIPERPPGDGDTPPRNEDRGIDERGRSGEIPFLSEVRDWLS